MYRIFEELKASGNLPSPSGVALEILRLAQSDHSSLEELAHLVKADPALAGRVLKLANSASVGADRPVLALKDALLKLGTNVLPQLALSLSIFDANQRGKCQAFDYAKFWSTSLLRALAAQAIAKLTRIRPAEEVFSIALVAEIGQLALAQIYPQAYSECLAANEVLLRDYGFCKECASRPSCQDENKQQLIADEQQRFAIDQNQITVAMLKDWQLPDWVLQTIGLYQQRDLSVTAQSGTEEKLAVQLRLAAILAGQVGLDFSVSSIQTVSEQLALDSAQLTTVVAELFQDWSEWKRMLCLDLEQVRDSEDITPTADVNVTESNANTGLQIMLVEDDRIQLHVLSTYLTHQGHRVTTATNGEDALRQLVLRTPDVLITDYRMQPMDGIALCKALRSNKEGQSVYVIMITAERDADTLSSAFQAGVNDFVGKPLNQMELDARLLGARRTAKLLGAQEVEHNNIRQYAFELATMTRRLEKMAVTDQLTGLANRRYAISLLEEEWANFMRTGGAFALLSLDLDRFKQINDQYGHDVGDRVLIHFANVLLTATRANDAACRMGGEEFIVIAPNTDQASIQALAERIREAVEKDQPTSLKLSRLITVSIGGAVSSASLDVNGWEDTLKRSDLVLYDAKASGRNRVAIYQDRMQRRHERICKQLSINVRRMTLSPAKECLATMGNISKSGMFLSCAMACLPELGEIVELQMLSTSFKKSPIGKVVRVVDGGFAVEFLRGCG